MSNALVVDEHAIGSRIVIANDGVHKFVDKSIRFESELFYREWNHRRKERRAWHLRVLSQPCFETAGNSRSLRHSAEASRMVHHPVALRHSELAKQEVSLARCGCDPVRISAAG